MADRVPFVGGSYNLKRKKADVQRSINLMPNRIESGSGKSPLYLQSVPGLDEFSGAPELPSHWSLARTFGATVSADRITASYPVDIVVGVMTAGELEQTTGKRYLEYFINASLRAGSNRPGIGFGVIPFSYSVGHSAPTQSHFIMDPFGNDGVNPTDGTAQFNPGDVVMFAIDLGTGGCWYGVNGVWKYGADPANGTGVRITVPLGAYAPLFWSQSSGGSVNLRTVASDYTYPPPNGFTDWNAL